MFITLKSVYHTNHYHKFRHALVIFGNHTLYFFKKLILIWFTMYNHPEIDHLGLFSPRVFFFTLYPRKQFCPILDSHFTPEIHFKNSLRLNFTH